MISKELLSEVLGYKVVDFFGGTWNTNPLYIFMNSNKDGDWTKKISTHTFANKCKLWADRKGYMIISYVNGHAKVEGWAELKYERTGKIVKECNPISDRDEPSAIYKMTQWIKDNK